jgi:hypothetical protein
MLAARLQHHAFTGRQEEEEEEEEAGLVLRASLAHKQAPASAAHARQLPWSRRRRTRRR